MAEESFRYTKEYWTGDSRDGKSENSDGYHYYRMTNAGVIVEAFEVYEREDGTPVVSPLPEMLNVNWLADLGFSDFEALDEIKQAEFDDIKAILAAEQT